MSRFATLRVVAGALLLGVAGCAGPQSGERAAVCTRVPAGSYTLLSVDSTSYEPAFARALMDQDYSACTAEMLAAPDSPYASALECGDAHTVYEREKGYIYRACTPGGDVVHVLSRAPVPPGHLPLPDTARTYPPPPGFEPIRLGSAYRLDLTPLPLGGAELVGYDSTMGRTSLGSMAIFETHPGGVSEELYERYRPLGSDLLLYGRYVRNGLRADTVSLRSEP